MEFVSSRIVDLRRRRNRFDLAALRAQPGASGQFGLQMTQLTRLPAIYR